MYNEQDWAPENIRDLVQGHFEKNSATSTSFAFDDAFSDADDSEANYALSSIVIRADLARTISYSQEGKVQEGADESSGTDATEDTGEPSPGLFVFVFSVRLPCSSMRALPLCRDTSSPNRDVNNLDTKFDSVSLSESPVEKLPHTEGHRYDVQEKSEVTDEGHERRHTGNDGTSETQHRAVDAEDSHSDPVALDATQESKPPFPPQSDVPPDVSASEDKPETPPGQTNHERSASTPSLPLPPVVTPPASSSSSSSPPSLINHKPRRSVGPSIFERVVSKTRPSFLPPKSRDEDQKHLADWERMMERSRAAGTP
jgi:TBC1 domain family member 14